MKEAKNGSTTVLTDTFTYSNPSTTATAGQVRKLQSVASGYNVTYTYTYDDNGNILSVSTSDGKSTTYTYDSANQLVRENSQAEGKTWVWTYDDAGNITSRNEYAYTTGSLGSVLSTINYTYGDSSWGDLLTRWYGKTITSDAIGNMLSDGMWTYTWEHGRELASMSNGGTTWTYTYNADGLRTKRTNGSTTYSYVYNGSSLSRMTVDGHTLDFTYDASGKPVSLTYDGTTYYYWLNLQGDVTAILDSSGNTVVGYNYDAWGDIVYIFGSHKDTVGFYNPLRYRGYVYDHETGLYYLQSRYYSPGLGRFINADAFTSTGQGLLGNNMFAYCRNHPTIRTDTGGTRDGSIWSFENDEVGREILYWYLYGDGEDFPSGREHSEYLKKNKLLKKQVQDYLFEMAGGINKGESVDIDVSIAVVIENGEDIIGYQYLHGTNADVGGFQIQGTITKLNNGDCIFDLTYTWNDIMDPNPVYASDVKKANFAKIIPFAKPSDYKISISWRDISIGPANGPSFHRRGFGWLYSTY